MSREYQFYALKFNSERLKSSKYKIEITFNQAKRNFEIIALADSQMLRTIRDIRGYYVDMNYIEELYNERKQLNKNKNANISKIKEVQNRINHLLWIPDYVTVVINNKSHYKRLFEQGFEINGKKYRRLSCSAGQARVSTVIFCNCEIIEEVKSRLNNGREEEKLFSPSKFNAYFGLYSSATKLVREPRFAVVKDYSNIVNFRAHYVTETAKEIDDIVEEKEVELEMNRTDGMGIISPELAKQWAEDLKLDYIPSQFVIRQSFLKGLVATFDFHKFAKEIAKQDKIKTVFKDEQGNYIYENVEDIDLIVSESQFKLWDSYKSKEQYIQNYRSNKLFWGISQYSPKNYGDILKLNYQFIQSLNMTEDNIKKLCNQFIDWVNKISYEDIDYTLLFLMGVKNTESSIKEILKSSDNYWLRSLIVNNDLIKDKYIVDKVKTYIKNKIKLAHIGEIIVNGNFQYIVSDPYAYCQYIFGQEITGLLNKDQFYSNYWNNKKVYKVDAMRSPLTYYSEHRILNFIKTDQTEEWYKYQNNGIILNWFGNETVHFSGADFDGDILATTDNQQIIDSVVKNELPVVYEAPKPKKVKITEQDLYISDLFSFGSKIGSITNKGSSGYCYLKDYEKKYGKNSQEYIVTLNRLRQDCKAQSAQIDKAKIGRQVKEIPEIWDREQKIYETDSEIIREEKEFYNSILLKKKPYFFKYRYSQVNKEIKDYESIKQKECGTFFNCTIEQLKNKNRSEEEELFYSYYLNKYPVIKNDSVMNYLCSYIEQFNFEINNKLNVFKDLQINFANIYKNSEIEYTKKEKYLILNGLKSFKDCIKYLTLLEENGENEKIFVPTLYDFLPEEIDNIDVLVNCLIDYYYIDNPSSNKDMLWKDFGLVIFQNILDKNKEDVYFPFQNEEGNIEYLGKKYKREKVICFE